MIDVYSGTPGSGKSIHCAKDIIYHVHNKGYPCIINFPFDTNAVYPRKDGGHFTVSNHTLTPNYLLYFSEKYRAQCNIKKIKEEQILLIIDEAQLIFNARHWNDKERILWIQFFTQHRKLGYHVILVAQYMEMLDKQIRTLVEYEYIHRKVSNIGIGGKILNTISAGNLHIAIKYYAPLKMKVGSEFFKAEKELYKLYDSYALF